MIPKTSGAQGRGSAVQSQHRPSAVDFDSNWHYALGFTTSQILDALNYHLQFSLSKGGMIKNWHRLRLIVQVWYEALAAEIQQSAVLHGDETG